MIISILPPIAVFLGIIGVIYSFYLAYERLKIEGRFTRAVHQVATQNKSIAKIQDVSRRSPYGRLAIVSADFDALSCINGIFSKKWGTRRPNLSGTSRNPTGFAKRPDY